MTDNYTMQPAQGQDDVTNVFHENKRIAYVIENTHVYMLDKDGFAEHVGSVDEKTAIIPLIKRLRGRL